MSIYPLPDIAVRGYAVLLTQRACPLIKYMELIHAFVVNIVGLYSGCITEQGSYLRGVMVGLKGHHSGYCRQSCSMDGRIKLQNIFGTSFTCALTVSDCIMEVKINK